MIYVFVVAFVLLYLRTWLVMVSQVGGLAALRAWTWDVQGGAAHLRWSFAVVGALLLLYLWSSSRAHLRADGESRGFRRLYVLLHLGAAILVLFCQWALVVALRGIPELTLTRLYP
jgi:hypothetical protein